MVGNAACFWNNTVEAFASLAKAGISVSGIWSGLDKATRNLRVRLIRTSDPSLEEKRSLFREERSYLPRLVGDTDYRDVQVQEISLESQSLLDEFLARGPGDGQPLEHLGQSSHPTHLV